MCPPGSLERPKSAMQVAAAVQAYLAERSRAPAFHTSAQLLNTLGNYVRRLSYFNPPIEGAASIVRGTPIGGYR
jgi:hypothetical protein